MPDRAFTDAKHEKQKKDGSYNPERFKPKPLDGTRRAWNRQPGESFQAYEAFMTYLTLPAEDRSLRKTAEVLGKSFSLMSHWSQQWSWTHRVGMYEEHYLLLKLESVEAERDAMWHRQQTLATTALGIVGGRLDQMIEAISDERDPGIKPDALVRLLDVAAKIDRMSVLGRISSAQEVQEKHERLAEQYSDELVGLLKEVMNETGMDEEQQKKLKEVLDRHLAGQSVGA